uniref:Uncharacterized protein n=1 Tax=Anopheles dirus TaxID=7168 RepID=A0A182MZG4_9DIPT
MATLEARFGRPDLIVESLIAKIRKMAAPKMEKLHTVVDFGFAVKRLLGTVRASGLQEYLFTCPCRSSDTVHIISQHMRGMILYHQVD